MTTALAEKAEKQPMALTEWSTMKEQAAMLVKTGFLPVSIKTPEQALAIALTGRELGIGMMEAIRGINVIQGKPSVSPQLMLALAIRTQQLESYSMNIVNGDAVVVIKRKGWPEHRVTFGPKEATALQLSGKDNYKKQPTVMYKWRALAEALRFTFPDAVSGIYTYDEMGAEMNAEGDLQLNRSVASTAQPTVAMPQEKAVEAEIMPEAPIAEIDKQISDQERALLFKIAKAAWGAKYEDNMRRYLKAKFNTEHTSKLSSEQYAQAVEDLKEAAMAAEANAGNTAA